MKKILLLMGLLLSLGLFCACSDDDELETASYDPTYKVSYYNHDPGLNVKQGYWVDDGFIEMIPQDKPPYYILVKWSDEKGKEAIDYILEKNPGVVSKTAEMPNNEYRITTSKYFESPYFFVSSTYNANEHYPGTLVLPQIIIKMKDGKDVKTIEELYASVLALEKQQNLKDTFIFNCNLKTSRDVLRLAVEISQHDHVQWAEPNMYGWYFFDSVKSVKAC